MRREGWESRLAAVLRLASARPYDPREWNCARFAHACAEAVCGRALPYRRRVSVQGSVDAIFARVDPKLALRGDVVMADVPEPSLGICTGARAVFVCRAGGLLAIRLTEVSAAWSVE